MTFGLQALFVFVLALIAIRLGVHWNAEANANDKHFLSDFTSQLIGQLKDRDKAYFEMLEQSQKRIKQLEERTKSLVQ